MHNVKEKNLDRILIAVAALMVALFSVTLFKHLSYPLLWNDEGDTAMFATRVLEYGFPKVYDGKNVVYVHPVDIKIGVNEFGMFVADPILIYYLAAPGAWLAEKAAGVYDKTLLFRLPFALAGLLGAFVMALAGAGLFEKGRPARPLFMALFFLFAALSVSLALHLREARYYSPLVLFSAVLFYSYFKHRLLGESGYKPYFAVSVFMLFLVYNTFYPLYFMLLASIGLYEIFTLSGKMRRERAPGRALAPPGLKDLKPFVPLIVSFITVIPLMIFFRTIEVALLKGSTVGFSMERYIANLQFIFGYFAKHEFLYIALLMKAALAFVLIPGRISGETLPEATAKKASASNFLTLFFLVHVFVTAATPLMFTRYFIVLLPVVTVVMLLDAFTVFEITKKYPGTSRKAWQGGLIAASAALFILGLAGKAWDRRGAPTSSPTSTRGPLISSCLSSLRTTRGPRTSS
ncbi:MAG: hypothetical protein HS130_05130 [Deltaproteobacteria bacterium]|nr:hypothetical protein [Deltaproteobacteria bacterium]MCL4874417.1 hypothetical protein [bacterium]